MNRTLLAFSVCENICGICNRQLFIDLPPATVARGNLEALVQTNPSHYQSFMMFLGRAHASPDNVHRPLFLLTVVDDVTSSFSRENRNWTFNGPTDPFAISEPFAVVVYATRRRRPNQPYGGCGDDLGGGGHSCFVIRSENERALVCIILFRVN